MVHPVANREIYNLGMVLDLVSEFSLNLYLCTGINWVRFRFGEELLVDNSTEF